MLYFRSINRFILISLALLGLSVSSANAALILQDQTAGTNTIWYAGVLGQTFTAEDAKISAIAFSFADVNNLTTIGRDIPNENISMLLYDGIGNAGSLLHTETQLLTPGIMKTFVDFNFSSVDLVVGSFYTAIVQSSNVRWAVDRGQHSTNSGPIAGKIDYVGGDAILDGAIETNLDLRFRVSPLSVSAVPIPAAAWLFGTALIGLVGLGKRRKAA